MDNKALEKIADALISIGNELKKLSKEKKEIKTNKKTVKQSSKQDEWESSKPCDHVRHYCDLQSEKNNREYTNKIEKENKEIKKKVKKSVKQEDSNFDNCRMISRCGGGGVC